MWKKGKFPCVNRRGILCYVGRGDSFVLYGKGEEIDAVGEGAESVGGLGTFCCAGRVCELLPCGK